MGGALTAESQIPTGADPQATFAAVYAQHAQAMYGAALRILGRPEEAEEAMQDTFLKYHRLQAGLDVSQVGGWLRRVLVNGCIDRMRHSNRRPETELNEAMLPAPAGPTRKVDLRGAVARLPERARMVFVLHDVEGFPHHEVGSMMGITTGSSKSQLFRARRLLRGLLEPES